MSNAGQAVLTIVGTAIGSMFSMPQLGFALGSLAGSALFPTQLPGASGPRLEDLKVTISTVGSSIPMLFGTYRIGGNVIWAQDIIEVENKETEGGKGGPEQEVTTYTYFASFHLSLCEGPIAGIRRVWIHGKLVYDRSCPPSVEKEIAADEFERNATFYLGTADQLPDPTAEAVEGVGNVPAYRGQAYISFADFPVTEFQGRIPQISVEVARDLDDVPANTGTDPDDNVGFELLDAA